MLAAPVQTLLDQLVGQRCWRARRGHGTFLTLELGAPVSELLPSGRAVIHGEWHLWLYCCAWTLGSRGRRLARWDRESVADATALRALRKPLVAVEVDPATGAARFTFGARRHVVLATQPWPDDPALDQWLLYCPDGRVLTARGTGEYSLAPGDARRARWRRLAR